jgi:hypothetical protein
MTDKFPVNAIQPLSPDNGKNAVFSIEALDDFPRPPFIEPSSKTLRNNKMLFSKLFNGTLTATTDFIRLDNSKSIHKPQFDLGHEIELDYVLTLTLKNGRYSMNYFDKETKKAIDLPFEGFMYFGGK